MNAPPPPPPPPPPAAVAGQAPPANDNFPHSLVADTCRKLEMARGQQAELEALLVFAASALSSDADTDKQDLPEALQDVYAELERVSADVMEDTVDTTASTTTTTTKSKNNFPPPGQFGKALETHVVAAAIQGAARQAADVYTARVTEGAAWKESIETIRSATATVDPLTTSHPFLAVLDNGVQALRMYHARQGHSNNHAARRVTADGFDLAARARQEWLQPLATLYRDAEVCGKYLDLQQEPAWISTLQQVVQHKNENDQPTNDDNATFDAMDLCQILCQGLDTLPAASKLAHRKAYERFLLQLEAYLRDYLKRTVPLLDVETEIVAPVVNQKEGKADAKDAEKNESIDLSKYDSADALQAAVDANTLKAELTRLGLKCGGTPADRAKRLFQTKGLDPDQWPTKIKAKGAAKNGTTFTNNALTVTSLTSTSATITTPTNLPLATREAVVTALLDQVRPALEATLKRLERQQGQTLAEREKEMEEDLYGAAVMPNKKRKVNDDGEEEDDDDDDGPVYNPKNVPLDWDGKPIPYWLFKLHGLQHVRSECVICFWLVAFLARFLTHNVFVLTHSTTHARFVPENRIVGDEILSFTLQIKSTQRV